MSLFRGALLLLSVLGLAGCAVPSVKYTVFNEQGRKEIRDTADTYMLSKSQLTISKKIADSDGEETESIAVALRRIEDPSYSFGITPWNRWYGVKTRVSLVKVNNTQVVQSVAVEVEDKRVEYIGSVFKLLGTIAQIPVAALAPEARLNKFPVVIDVVDELHKGSCSRKACNLDLLDKSMWGLTASLDVSPVPPDAIDVGVVVSPEVLSTASGVFFAAACRQATLRVSDIAGSDLDFVQHFSIADPRYVQIIGLPAKGSISAHDECGYSVVPEAVELKNDVEVADSFFEKLFAFRKAYRESQDKEDGAAEEE